MPPSSRVLIDQGVLDNDRADAKTILVVDDDPGTLALHTRLLRQQSAQYRVLQARNGHEALAVLRQTRPDLVLLDLLMAKLDGFGVLEAMRAMETTRDVPVVVLTAQTLTEAEMERLNRGVATVLSKGVFSAAEIMAHIEAALARKRGLGSPTQWLVRKAIAFIHAHYAEPLARGQIARYVGISADYLTECFHQELGVTPIAYLNRYRIHQAQALLADGDRSVTEVALTVGFTDSNHFSRMCSGQFDVAQPPAGLKPSATGTKPASAG